MREVIASLPLEQRPVYNTRLSWFEGAVGRGSLACVGHPLFDVGRDPALASRRGLRLFGNRDEEPIVRLAAWASAVGALRGLPLEVICEDMPAPRGKTDVRAA